MNKCYFTFYFLPDRSWEAYLFLSTAVIHHAVLGGHGGGLVQAGGVEGHLLDLGDAVGNVGHAQALGLVFVPPVLEELLEERRLAHLWQDLHLSVFGVVHLLDELVGCFHRCLSLVHVGVFACKQETGEQILVFVTPGQKYTDKIWDCCYNHC